MPEDDRKKCYLSHFPPYFCRFFHLTNRLTLFVGAVTFGFVECLSTIAVLFTFRPIDPPTADERLEVDALVASAADEVIATFALPTLLLLFNEVSWKEHHSHKDWSRQEW